MSELIKNRRTELALSQTALGVRAGVPAMNPHGLRHTMATAALSSGVPAVVVQKRLGHKTLAMTLGVYAHVLEGQETGAAASIAAAYRTVRDQSVTEGEEIA